MSFVEEYRRSMKAAEVEETVDLAVYRPLGFLVVKAVYKTSITPNQITLFSVFVGLLAGLCYASGRRPAVVAGALLLAFSVVLDCADGQLARLKKNGTRFGRILDGLVDYIVGLSVCIGMWIGLAPEDNLWKWVLLLAAVIASQIIHSALVDYYRARFIDAFQGTTTHLEDEDYRSVEKDLANLRAAGGKPFRKLSLRLYLRYCRMQKRLTVRNSDSTELAKLNPEGFRKLNRAAMRGWSFLGASTANTWFIISTLVGRVDLFFWGLIVVGNIWAVGMYAYQAWVDRRIAREAVA